MFSIVLALTASIDDWSRMSLEAAMEWLLSHDDDEADAPLTADQKRQLAAMYGPVPTVDPRAQQAISANICTYAVTGPHFTAQVSLCLNLFSRVGPYDCATAPRTGTSATRVTSRATKDVVRFVRAFVTEAISYRESITLASFTATAARECTVSSAGPSVFRLLRAISSNRGAQAV